MAVALERGVGPNLGHGAVRPDACERQRRRHIDVGRKSRRGVPSTSGEDELGRVQPFHRNAVCYQIRSTREAAGRLARDQPHGVNAAFGRGGDRVETSSAPLGTMI